MIKNSLSRTGTFSLFVLLSTSCLTGCQGQIDRLSRVGSTPKIDKMTMPEESENYDSIQWPHGNDTSKPNPSSLWQPGSFSFFKDRKARQVGDILRVSVKVKDKAQLDSSATQSRGAKETATAPAALGLEKLATGWLPGKAVLSDLINVDGSRNHTGTGKIDRGETIETEVAAMVTQILPNGNLVIHGDQEIRVNYELRKITISGIVRAEDIGADNAISSSQIAQARISYGGKGQLTDTQQPRIGHQIIDAISPF